MQSDLRDEQLLTLQAFVVVPGDSHFSAGHGCSRWQHWVAVGPHSRVVLLVAAAARCQGWQACSENAFWSELQPLPTWEMGRALASSLQCLHTPSLLGSASGLACLLPGSAGEGIFVILLPSSHLLHPVWNTIVLMCRPPDPLGCPFGTVT